MPGIPLMNESVIFLKRLKNIVLSLLLVLALAGCRGSELPAGMDSETLLAAGQDVMLHLVEEEFEAVYEMLREDQRALFTVEDISRVVSSQLSGAGEYKQIEKRMTTGSTIDGERYGIAVFYCDFSEEDVLVRISFDAQMQLVGFSLKQD